MNLQNAAASYVFEPAAIPAVLPVAGYDACCFRCTASIASAATMPRTPSRWATTRTRSRPSSSRRTPTTSYSAASSPIRRRRTTCTTRSRWWWRSKSGGADIPVEKALDHVFGYGVGLDMTRRDLQGKAKDMGRPWEVGKAFEASAPARRWCRRASIGHPIAGRDLARRQRRAAADRRPQPDDLEGAGDDQLPLRPVHARARRHDLFGHAGRRRRRQARRRYARPHRRRRRSRGAGRVGARVARTGRRR